MNKAFRVFVPVLFSILAFGASASSAFAATINISADTDWSAIITGSGPGGQPSFNDNIVVGVTADTVLTVDVSNAVCNAIQLGHRSADKKGTLTFNSGSKLTVVGDVTVGGPSAGAEGAGSIIMTSGGTLQIGGSVIIAKLGTFTPGTGTIEYDAAGAQTISSGLGAAYNNLTLSGSGTKTAGGVITVNGNLSVGAGTTFSTANSVNIGSDWTINGTFTQTAGTTTFTAATHTLSGSGSIQFSNLTITSGGTINANSSNLTVSSAFTMSGATLNANSSTIKLAGNWTASSGSFNAGIGTVTFNGSAGQTQPIISGFLHFNNVTINKSGGTMTSGYTWTADNDFNLTNGTLAPASNSAFKNVSIGSGGTFTAPVGNIYISGNWSNHGTFTAGTGTVTFNGTGTQTINNANTWYGLAITGTTARIVSLQSGVLQTVSHNLTLTGVAGQLLTLVPLTSASEWQIHAPTTQTVHYVSLSYSDASGGTIVNAADGTNTNGGNNTNWNFAINQTITVNTRVPASAVYGATFGIAATASSGLDVAITADGGCSGGGTGSATVTMMSGTTACVVHYNQEGNGFYNAATEVTETATATKAETATIITCPTSPETYNGSAIEPCTSTTTVIGAGDLNEEIIVDYTNNINAGTAHANATYDGDTNYTGSRGDSKTFTIDKVAITVTAMHNEKTYNADTSAEATPVITSGALQGADTAGFTEIYDDKNAGTNKTLTPSGIINDENDGNNYSYTSVPDTTGVINTKSLTVTADSNQSKIFGASNPELTYHITSGSLEEGDSLSGSLVRGQGEDVESSYRITLGDLSADPNYNLSFIGANFAITPADAPITTEGDSLNPDYNGTPRAVSVVTTPPGVSISIIYTGSSVEYGPSANAPIDAGTYSVTAQITDPNYNSNSDTKDLTIHKISATVNVNGYSGTYEGFAHGATGTATGVGDADLSGSLNFGDSFMDFPGGTAHWVFTGGTNYIDENDEVTIDISKASLSVTPDNKAKIEGTTFTAFTGVINGIKNDDNITSTYESEGAGISATVGSYPITTSIVDPGEKSGNYNITLNTGTLEVSTHVISASAGTNGTIDPSGGVGLADGASQSFTITPSETYHVADVLVDGDSIGAVPSYEFTNVTADHTISASFVADTTKTVSTGEGNTTTTSIDTGDVTVDIPASTNVTGPVDWDGTITPPTVTTTYTAPSPDSGFDSTTSVIALEMGAGDTALTFDQPVKITFAGQTDNYVGWSRGGVFTEITAICNSATNPTLADGADCKIDVESDLVVWTKHFTTFVTYTQTAKSVTPPSSSHGGGNACGNGFVFNPATLSCDRRATPAIPAAPGVSPATPAIPQGQVLGASIFNFTRNLGLGLSGADVTALQQILIDAGILKINAPTGNFGQLTKAAVQAFQKSHGVSQTGFVGSLTRGELNKGTNLTTAQADAILSFLESFDAGASVVANAKASFGR